MFKPRRQEAVHLVGSRDRDWLALLPESVMQNWGSKHGSVEGYAVLAAKESKGYVSRHVTDQGWPKLAPIQRYVGEMEACVLCGLCCFSSQAITKPCVVLELNIHLGLRSCNKSLTDQNLMQNRPYCSWYDQHTHDSCFNSTLCCCFLVLANIAESH